MLKALRAVADGNASPLKSFAQERLIGILRPIWPKSNFHLSMGLDYPNAADRVHSDPERPGFDIYIHGNNVSIGCLAIGDDMIEELYLLTADFRGASKVTIPVHIFPARMQGDDWNALREQFPQHANFWGELEPIYRAFEESRRLPAVKVDRNGSYAIEG